MNSTAQDFEILMQTNLLDYSSPIDGSLADLRQSKKNLFNPSSYSPGQQMQCQAQGGGDYINASGSYILATVNLTNTGTGPTMSWNHITDNSANNGSAFNLFKEVQVQHRGGQELDRTENINALVSCLVDYAFDSSYREKFASVFGYGNKVDFIAPASATGYSAGARTYAFPLGLLSGLFNQKALLPAQLFSALKINIQLESAATATVSTVTSGDSAPSYALTDVTLVLDSIDIYDAAKRSLLEAAANVSSRGLQVSYYSYFNLKKTESSANLNFDLNISAAKVMQVIIKSRLTPTITNPLVNSMNSEPYSYNRWRFRLGAHVMPLHYVENANESYMITQQAFGGTPDLDILNPRPVQCGVSFEDYRMPSLQAATNPSVGRAIVAMSMDKNPIVSLSGVVSNNAMLLNFEATLSSGTSRQFDAWIKHARVANIMIDNCIVDR